MGRSKLDLELGGRTFMQRAIDAAAGARGVEWCVVVVRPEDEDRAAAAVARDRALPLNARSVPPGTSSGNEAGAPQVDVLLNPNAAEGQSASIRLAVQRMAEDPEVEAAIFSVVDQPFLTPAVFEALIETWRQTPDSICLSSYAAQRGNPALFPRRFFGELMELAGDVGGRDVIRRHPDDVREVAMPDPNAGRDVDTWEEYLEAQRLVER